MDNVFTDDISMNFVPRNEGLNQTQELTKDSGTVVCTTIARNSGVAYPPSYLYSDPNEASEVVTKDGDAAGSNHENGQSLVISGSFVEHKVGVDYTGPLVQENYLFSESIGSVRGETNGLALEPEEGPGASLQGTKYHHTDFKDVDARLGTLKNWPRTRPSKEAIANAGLFSRGVLDKDDDTVVCFKCGEELSHFEDDDDPQAEHDRLFKDCKTRNWY